MVKVIFKNVMELKSNSDKSFFKEKIDIYIKIVTAVKKKYDLQKPYIDHRLCLEEMVRIGVILNDQDADALKSFLKEKVYEQFMTAIAYVLENEELFRPFVKQLSNAERVMEQYNERNREAFTLVDLFCGAGGLSLGFKQSGFKTLLANDFDSMCIETYKYNHPEIPSSKVICGDIRELSNHCLLYTSPSPRDRV